MKIQAVIYLLIPFYSVTGFTAETERLINTRDTYPSVSPDSKQLVFQSNRSGSDQLYIMDLENGQTRRLTSMKMGAESPVFSNDGQHIVFGAYVDEGNNDVFVMKKDGSDIKRLTFGPGYDGHPHWSANGRRIVFNSDRTSPDLEASWSKRWHEIFSMKTDGSDIRQHTQCETVCTYGSLSPDGDKVLYRKVIDASGLDWSLGAIDRNSEIFIADSDGDNEINLTKNAAFDGWPVFSPDGNQIAFASNRTGPALTGQIWLVNPDGSGLRQVSYGPWSHVQPAWAHDGQSVYTYQHKETTTDEFGSIVRIAID